MDKSASATPAYPEGQHIAIREGDWEAYRSHISSLAGSTAGKRGQPSAMPEDETIDTAHAVAGADAAGAPLSGEKDVLAYRRECARAYIGMNGRLGGRTYRPNAPVILTPDTISELAELNRLLREERALHKAKKTG